MFFKNFSKTFYYEDLIVKGDLIYIPSSLKKKILNAFHEVIRGLLKLSNF